MHPKEYRKQKNGTGHMTHLQLENSEIIVGVDFTHNTRVNEILANEHSSSFLLYPGKDSFNLSIRQPAETHAVMGAAPHIFLLDGTWPCARKMLTLSTNLQQLKRVSFDATITSKFIIKQQPEALCLSTIESIYTVLNVLHASGFEHCDTKHFLIPFEKMIAHQLAYMRNPKSTHYCAAAKSAFMPKDSYKNSERNVVFELEGL